MTKRKRKRRKRIDYFAGAAGIFNKDKHWNKKQWVIQEKKDGQYCEFDTDEDGCISVLRSKTGFPIENDEAKKMKGIFAGYPNATIVGELTSHTETGKSDTLLRGYPVIHCFDILRTFDDLIIEQPYSFRYETLQKMHAELQEFKGPDKVHSLDNKGNAHDFNGRFTQNIPKSWKRTPILSCFIMERFDEIWDRCVVQQGGEGIVLVDWDAPVGKRGSKLKHKPIDTIDAEVIKVTNNVARVAYYDLNTMEVGVPICNTTKRQILVSNQGECSLRVGETVEIAFQGYYKSGRPMFARVIAKRTDL